MEIPLSNEANVSDLYGSIASPWTWFPEGVPINRILDREFFTKNFVVHRKIMEGEAENKLTAGADKNRNRRRRPHPRQALRLSYQLL
jgi:hypothetical protein